MIILDVVLEFIATIILFYLYVLIWRFIIGIFEIQFEGELFAVLLIISVFLYINYSINYYLRCRFSLSVITKYKLKHKLTEENMTNSEKIYIEKWKKKIKKEASLGAIIQTVIVLPFVFIGMFTSIFNSTESGPFNINSGPLLSNTGPTGLKKNL
tara:strand:+ start:452 stop:916 length:465 start_codon:yes stop_codon:yes gene_type:complete